MSATSKSAIAKEQALSFSQRLSEIKTGFERPFWVANVTEFFERLSYYAVFAVIVRYLHENLKFSVAGGQFAQRTIRWPGLVSGNLWRNDR